jgi:hypothetical protein
MVSSGTYDFQPSLGELVLYAYNLIQVRPTSIVQEHMESARMAMNLLLAEWSNDTPNLWKVDLVEVALVEGQATYSVDPSTIVMLDAYIRIDDGSGSPPQDRIILPISRTEYASYPNKEQQGFPTVFWYDRLINPEVTLWQVPDGVSAQFLRYYRVRQIQDAGFASGQTADLPLRWLPAFANGLALQLARIWNPGAIAAVAPFAEKSLMKAQGQDVETAALYVTPMLGSYYR